MFVIHLVLLDLMLFGLIQAIAYKSADVFLLDFDSIF